MKYAIEIKNLTKTYNKYKAVDNLCINVPEGKIYGFLGKNGAGKTTTIRMIMGLVKPQHGEILVLGRDALKNRQWSARNIGAVVETPGFYENLTARGNLNITAELFGVNRRRVDEVLEIVKLSDAGDKKAKNFSLGMKQRLGIANALVHSPKILILDEPANGLDPEGIKDIRLFLRDLAQNHGITVMVSSHILSEVQLMADYVGIIDSGRLLAETDMSSLMTAKQSGLLLEVDRMDEALHILDRMKLHHDVENGQIRVHCDRDMNCMINKNLVNNNINVYSLASASLSLEEMFLSITNGNSGQDIQATV